MGTSSQIAIAMGVVGGIVGLKYGLEVGLTVAFTLSALWIIADRLRNIQEVLTSKK